jgi:hypothetical protein
MARIAVQRRSIAATPPSPIITNFARRCEGFSLVEILAPSDGESGSPLAQDYRGRWKFDIPQPETWNGSA